MTVFGQLDVPDELLVPAYARRLLGDHLSRDEHGHLYSGAAFDTYPDPLPPSPQDVITDSDLIALSLLGVRVTGHEALAITRHRADEIHRLLGAIPAHVRIEDDDADRLLHCDGPAWKLWTLLCGIHDRTKASRLGPVAAGKLMARKRPDLIPIADSRTAKAFHRPDPGADRRWWDAVRAASLDRNEEADGTTLWDYLASLRDVPGAAHLPTLRVLDILAWMHVGPGADDT